MIKKVFAVGIILLGYSALAQEKYNFTPLRINEATPVKNQDLTGTCWSFSSASFLESEFLRKNKTAIDLSEMYIVHKIYEQKAENFVRRQGKANFDEGSLAHDYIDNMLRYGLIPESAYSGRTSDSIPYNSAEMLQVLTAVMPAFTEGTGSGKVSTTYPKTVSAILDVYMGAIPTTFSYNGKSYTPQRFAQEVVQLNPKDYVSLTSFTHHPFYQPFVLEVPDNWSNGSFYNVPLADLTSIAIKALENGYTICWDADVSEKEFMAKKGVAIVPAKAWKDKTEDEQNGTGIFVEAEKNISQELRQAMFDTQATTDDHLMHIVGLAKDQNGATWFVVKNSWGKAVGREEMQGHVYVSMAYFQLKTVAITLNKEAIGKEQKTKLNF